MQDCLASLKKEMPELERAYYKQDNAGCYHSGYTIVSAKLAGDIAGVVVERNDFSDPQGGKGVCDRQATIKGDVGRHINEGHDVTTAVELKTAIESGPESCVKASYVSLSTSSGRVLACLTTSNMKRAEYVRGELSMRVQGT